MYYAEKMIDGVLHYRNTPDGEWRTVNTQRSISINAMYALSTDERVDVMSAYCSGCGSMFTPCHCQNDG